MTKDEGILMKYMQFLNHLSIDLKLKLIALLTESISKDVEKKVPKNEDWKSLYGSWKDMDDNIVNEIREARMSERDVIKF
jgi:hypothetical protein